MYLLQDNEKSDNILAIKHSAANRVDGPASN